MPLYSWGVMTKPDPLEAALSALREGKGRGAVVRSLRALGLESAEADRLYHRARSARLRENLPDELRRSSRLHLAIGLGTGVFSLGLVALTGLLVRGMYFSEAAKPLTGDLGILWSALSSLGCLGLSIGEILYARRRLKEARELESPPPSDG
jgi:hypothetical protein